MIEGKIPSSSVNCRPYRDGEAAWEQRKSGVMGLPQTGQGHTTRGRRMTSHGRRWRAADGLLNGNRSWRPANRVIEYY